MLIACVVHVCKFAPFEQIINSHLFISNFILVFRGVGLNHHLGSPSHEPDQT